jgi:RHS repeat-associated protein
LIKTMPCIALMFLLLMSKNSYSDTLIINVYDANGNLVTGDGRYYEYNDASQLVRVKQGDQTGPVIAEYFYDASGQRVKKIENGVVTYYIGKHFEKQIGGSNAGNTSYYFGDGGERVAKKDPAGNIFYYHLDHLDGVNAVTDSSGTIVARTDYLPFGDVRSGSSSSDKYSYTGKEKDKTNLYYFEARYNSPEFRHFTQADIAEPDYTDPQDLNRYSYVGNNPLSYVDYDGFKKKKKHLSKREQRARSLGLNPDKDKYKVGKMSHKEYKRALKAHQETEKNKTIAKSSTRTMPSSQQAYISTNSGSKIISHKNSNSKLQQIQYMYAYSAALAEEAAYWDALADTLEGVHGALKASMSLLSGDVKGAFGNVLGMGSTLARITGHGKTAAILSGTSSVIEIAGLAGTGKDFYRALDGRTRQASAFFKQNVHEDISKVSDLAKDMHSFIVTMPFDLFENAIGD